MMQTKKLKIEKHTSDGSGQLDCLPFSSAQDQPMNVPLLDLKAHHAPIKDEVLSKISEVIDCNAFAGGTGGSLCCINKFVGTRRLALST